MKPCLTCGTPSAESHCEEHQPRPWQHREGSARAGGYTPAWDELSRRARKLQLFCSECFTTEDLTTDHKLTAWERQAAGKPIPLRTWRSSAPAATCAAGAAGRDRSARPQMGSPVDPASGPGGKPRSPSHFGELDLNRHFVDVVCRVSRPFVDSLNGFGAGGLR